MQIFEHALTSDPIYQQAIAQQLSDQESIAISRSALLPTIAINSRIQTPNQNETTLSITQTIFDFKKNSHLNASYHTANQAEANLNAANQDLMIRVSKNYFAILNDEENLQLLTENKKSYANQLKQVLAQYQARLKTIIDVNTAEAAYDRAAADEMRAQTQLMSDKENLRIQTGRFYNIISQPNKKLPILSKKISLNNWTMTALQQNWEIKSAQLAATNARENIKEQYAGHFPLLNAEANYGRFNKSLSLNLIIPIYQGGFVSSKTRQAHDNYQIETQKLDLKIREVIKKTRENYFNLQNGIKQIEADKKSIHSAEKSLTGMLIGYDAGMMTLTDVLNQQQKVFQAKQQYVNDYYNYLNHYLLLKQAAGILSTRDLFVFFH